MGDDAVRKRRLCYVRQQYGKKFFRHFVVPLNLAKKLASQHTGNNIVHFVKARYLAG